jgi:hypothetical protein
MQTLQYYLQVKRYQALAQAARNEYCVAQRACRRWPILVLVAG